MARGSLTVLAPEEAEEAEEAVVVQQLVWVVFGVLGGGLGLMAAAAVVAGELTLEKLGDVVVGEEAQVQAQVQVKHGEPWVVRRAVIPGLLHAVVEQ